MLTTSIETLQGDARERGNRRDPRAPYLVVALVAEKPLLGSSRHSLEGIDVVVIGRGEERSVERVTWGDQRCLVLRVPDAWMSKEHARIVLGDGRRVLRDAGSRNGTFLDGEPRTAAALSDGDVFEAGHTFFLYREGEALPEGVPADVAIDDPDGGVPGLTTLVPPLAEELTLVERVAASSVSVVMNAESGTGKELLARAIHRLSRRSGAFVAINCGAIPASLVETELFGYRKGAFSGAVEDRPGLVRGADRGTLFLDEIGDLPAASQAAFLRVLQEREVVPVGAIRPTPVDVRLVAATHRRLDDLVAEGRFRADLLARISGYTLRLPALCDRREDTGLLVATLLRRFAGEAASQITFRSAAVRALFRYTWPLNIRELEKCLETAIVLSRGEPIDVAHLPDPVRASLAKPPPSSRPSEGPPPSRLSAEDEARREELVALLREHGGNITAVARATGKARMQIQRWIKRYAILRDR